MLVYVFWDWQKRFFDFSFTTLALLLDLSVAILFLTRSSYKKMVTYGLFYDETTALTLIIHFMQLLNTHTTFNCVIFLLSPPKQFIEKHENDTYRQLQCNQLRRLSFECFFDHTWSRQMLRLFQIISQLNHSTCNAKIMLTVWNKITNLNR